METAAKYMQTLERIESGIKQMRDQAAAVRWFYENNGPNESFRRALMLEEAAEKTVLLTRTLPAYTGRPHAADDVESICEQAVPIEIGYTEDGWFSLRIPALLPKKEEGSAEYIRALLYPAMQRFFRKQVPIRYRNCVLIFRHVYDRARPERQKRDHDNIEVNMVSDIVALYVMPDDAPSVCSHYYCSAEASADRTEVYVVPKTEFTVWLATESAMPDKGVTLYENRFLWRKKHM